MHHLSRNRQLLQERLGADLVVRKAAVRDPSKDRGLDAACLTTDWREVVSDPQVDIVVELMGGTESAADVALATIDAGKPLVTANKALLAEKGEPIFLKAGENNVSIYFEASIAGGIPIVKALREGLNANDILSIHGIINGTCNYILSRMTDEGAEFDPILQEAKALGYAEADESLDVDGIDAAHKAALLATITYGFWVPIEKVVVEGIRDISAADIAFARQLGYRIILLATIKPHELEEGMRRIEVRVQPTLVPLSHILASVTGVFNAISVVGDVVGESLFYGRGAGSGPTASAVISDIIEAAHEILHQAPPRHLRLGQSKGMVLDRDDIVRPYYTRLQVVNRPGVLAQVAEILGNHDIGISSVFQPEKHEDVDVPLVILLDSARESNLRNAIDRIEQLPVVKAKCQVIGVEDFL